MATATTTKRARKPATPKAPKAPEAPTTSDPASDEVKAPTSNGTELKAAYWQAIDNRDQAKGEIPETHLDAVKAAYRQADPRKRTNLVKALTLEASAKIVSDTGEVDPGLALGVKALSAALSEARDEATRSERPPHDPVPEVARILADLDKFRAELVAALTDDQREQLPSIAVTEDEAADSGLGKALDRIRERALNGRTGYSGPRTPASQTADAVRNAVHAADAPLTLTELAKAAGIEGSTAYTRHTADNTPGVKAITDDQGRRVFIKDTDAA